MTRHKWHKEIKAWADGAEVECQDKGCNDWYSVQSIICFIEKDSIFRMKPQPKEPQYAYAWLNKDDGSILLEHEPAHGVIEDDFYKYLGRIKLEVNDDY